MTAYNVVRFRVKPGMEQQFIEAQRKSTETPLPGALGGALIKTGDRTYCFIVQWKSFGDIVAARTQMISFLDEVRPLLEDLGNGLGVTDPVSGEAVFEIKPPA
jgi:Antibiotic biosynthesis monooxygenase